MLLLIDNTTDKYYMSSKYAPLARIAGVDRRTMKKAFEGKKVYKLRNYTLKIGDYVK